MRSARAILILSSVMALAPARAALMTYGFHCISSGVAAACASGQSQLWLDVTDQSGGSTLTGQALFIFRNAGPAPSSITDVYFDDGTLLGIASVQNSAGVSFSQGAAPPNLPGGNAMTPAFRTTAGFSADSNAPTQPNGANPGERVGVLFNLLPGATYFDVIAALNGNVVHADGAPALRVGLHAQGFADGASAAFVNDTRSLAASTVPLPAAAWLLLGGLVALGSRRGQPGRAPASRVPTDRARSGRACCC